MHIPESKYFPKFNSESFERKHKKETRLTVLCSF